MEDLIAFANTHQGAVTALATAVIALAAVVTALLTFSLIRENRLLRKAGTEPEVIAYLTPDPRFKTMVNFVLANVGQGPARNVQFTFEADEMDFTTHNVQISNKVERKAISTLPQGERIDVFFGAGHELFMEPRLRPFKVSIQYEDINGRRRRCEYRLDVSQFDGLITLGSPAEHEVAEALKKIERHMNSLATDLKLLKV